MIKVFLFLSSWWNSARKSHILDIYVFLFTIYAFKFCSRYSCFVLFLLLWKTICRRWSCSSFFLFPFMSWEKNLDCRVILTVSTVTSSCSEDPSIFFFIYGIKTFKRHWISIPPWTRGETQEVRYKLSPPILSKKRFVNL